MDLWHQILEFFGVVGESGKGYAFWSGVGSDIGELAIVGSLLGLLRARNCHVDRCWRIGRRTVDGTSYVVCRRHHPEPGLTHERLLAEYRAHKERRAQAREPAVVASAPPVTTP